MKCLLLKRAFYLGKYSSFSSRMSFQNWLRYWFIRAFPQTWRKQRSGVIHSCFQRQRKWSLDLGLKSFRDCGHFTWHFFMVHGPVMQAADCLKQQTHLIMCRMCPDSPLESQTAESLWRLPEAPCWASEPTNASRGSDHEERAETKK